MTVPPLRVALEREHRVLHLRLDRPKANIIDAQMLAALEDALTDHLQQPKLRAVVLSAEGPHFSFGASVEEHLPAQCAAMLRSMHRVVAAIVESPVPVLVAVRGQCLGGGLELALGAHLIFAAPDAKLAQPEIRLGVFAPAASALLPLRVPRVRAEDMLLSGRTVTAAEALQMGLVAGVADDPLNAAWQYYDEHLAALSASSLRFAVRAARVGFVEEARRRLAQVETLYLEELMRSRDATEGLEAFLAKRPPAWTDS
jgi:cyclohexa-1,5-dienecarbonyl-CoA hydratase